jgi:hypothetical protein
MDTRQSKVISGAAPPLMGAQAGIKPGPYTHRQGDCGELCTDMQKYPAIRVSGNSRLPCW